MRIVICASNGEDLFSGASVLTMPPPRGDESEPPISGVFPTAVAYDAGARDDEGSALPCGTSSGIFPRNDGRDEATMTFSLEEIDASWCDAERACA